MGLLIVNGIRNKLQPVFIGVTFDEFKLIASTQSFK